MPPESMAGRIDRFSRESAFSQAWPSDPGVGLVACTDLPDDVLKSVIVPVQSFLARPLNSFAVKPYIGQSPTGVGLSTTSVIKG